MSTDCQLVEGKFDAVVQNLVTGTCRLSQAQFVTYNPELQIFSSSIISFDFTDGGSILVCLPVMFLYPTACKILSDSL